MNPLLERLRQEGLTVLVVRGEEELYRSTLSGVRPLLELWSLYAGTQAAPLSAGPACRGVGRLAGATVADRVVGGCAARVFLHLGVERVFALVGSIPARAILTAAGIGFEVERGVLEIRNRNGTDTCPFERLSRHCRRPGNLVPAMARLLDALGRGSVRPGAAGVPRVAPELRPGAVVELPRAADRPETAG
ncbi:MAG: DUF1893 domain-containing protein [bacterium]